jgi:hypothetical protein
VNWLSTMMMPSVPAATFPQISADHGAIVAGFFESAI